MKYVFIFLISLIVIDQIGARVADKYIRGTPDFFKTVLKKADLTMQSSQDTGSYLYQSCDYHQVMIVYYARTCFGKNGETNPSRYGDDRELVGLFYWPPQSKFFFFFSRYYYDELCCNTMLMYVSRDNHIIEDFGKND